MTTDSIEWLETDHRGNSRSARWICLLYHDVLPRTSARGGGTERFAVPLASFERTLDIVAEEGYRGCSLATALTDRARPRVAITFDDGTRSQFDHAVPALLARAMTATFYVTTDWVGTNGHMSWDELRQLVAWGMSVQSHTRSHPFLSELTAGEVREELANSKAALDDELAQSTIELALPGGDAPRRALRHLFGEAGYEVVADSRWGINADSSAVKSTTRPIHRCSVRGDISVRAARRLIAGDAWLALSRHSREAALRGIRSALGASRYARWRRHVLDGFVGDR